MTASGDVEGEAVQGGLHDLLGVRVHHVRKVGLHGVGWGATLIGGHNVAQGVHHGGGGLEPVVPRSPVGVALDHNNCTWSGVL